MVRQLVELRELVRGHPVERPVGPIGRLDVFNLQPSIGTCNFATSKGCCYANQPSSPVSERYPLSGPVSTFSRTR